MKILVAGGFGYVGARLAAALGAAGHEVVLGSRKLRPTPAWLPNARVCEMDWDSRSELEEVCANMDAVVQAAGMNAGECEKNTVGALQVNGVGTARLVEAAASAGVSRFFYLSTAHVYASPLQGNINELSYTSNSHPYASSHLAGELSVLYALSRDWLSGSVLRLSNGFGAPMSPDTNCWMLLANDLCRQAVTTGKLVLQTSGEQLRDFVPLAGVCSSLNRLLELPTGALPSILNIGSSNSISVSTMAQLVQERCTAILGFTPVIEMGKRTEATFHLHYSSLYASQLGIVNADAVVEMEQLLDFCKTNFKFNN